MLRESDIPANLRAGPVWLRLDKIGPGDDSQGLVPFYRFDLMHENAVVGNMTLKVGHTTHVTQYVGHIGYNVHEEHRGNSYSYYGCFALIPLIRVHFDSIIITVEVGNTPSIRIIEKLKARFINEVQVSENDPAYRGGARRKLRYHWEIPDE